MLLLAALSMILWVGGAWLSLNTPEHPRLNESSRIHGWILVGFFFLLFAWFGAIMSVFGTFGQLAATLLLGVTGICWAVYFSTMGGHFFCVALPRWWMRDHKIKVIVSFDQGDAAMKAGDPERAVRLYRAELEKQPDNPELFLRLADAYRALKDPAQVVTSLRSAARVSAPEGRGAVSLMMADELRKSGDRGGAEAVLHALLKDPELSKFHAGAKARLQKPFG